MSGNSNLLDVLYIKCRLSVVKLFGITKSNLCLYLIRYVCNVINLQLLQTYVKFSKVDALRVIEGFAYC